MTAAVRALQPSATRFVHTDDLLRRPTIGDQFSQGAAVARFSSTLIGFLMLQGLQAGFMPCDGTQRRKAKPTLIGITSALVLSIALNAALGDLERQNRCS